ncbi:MAG TPA: aminopeptidase [Candidatus Latescibacteria bacterium]|nr:aminopeptidase [Candidatus Latescibacterota bacterium]HOS63543.1 aminopeptidase [Candidatus Latescibacterota bacterium]HPK73293.1 aminopeptidase [Candidatus Latescibacterota bacterium]
MSESSLMRAARVAVGQCLGVQKSEQVIVIADAPCLSIGRALFEASVETGADTQLIEILPRAENGSEPPPPVAAAMTAAHVVFAPTSKSLTHTEARRAASEAGARIATLPGITEDIMSRALLADYEAIAERTQRVAIALQGKKTIRVTTAAGTDISFSIEGRKVSADTGILRNPGVTNLPAGEAYLAPVEGTGRGLIVIDGCIGSSGVLREPIEVVVEAGMATIIRGNVYAETLVARMDAAGPEARNLAELGIGTNDAARLTGQVLEDEKILGTVHLAFGDNRSMGGIVRAPFHQDGILLRPTVWADGCLILDDGVLMV